MGTERNNGISINKKTIDGLKDTIAALYEADDIPWVIGYSGGKDSTAALQLVWLTLRQIPEYRRTKTVHVINTDTLVESPIVSKWVEKSLVSMQNAADSDNIPILTHRLTPDTDNTFWVNFLGRGYPFPRKKFRWCTDRLKIKPVNKFIQSKIAEHGEIILVLGTRKAESAKRARTMAYYEKKRVRELLSPNPTLANELVFSPLEDWSNDDVWFFLMQYQNPWGYSNMELLTLYKGATEDNECPLMVDKDLPSCGNSRFGCWVCTMVAQDKSMTAMISNDIEKEWLSPLLEFRNEFGDEENDRERRSFRKMGGFLQGTYGRLHHGPYLKEYREKWLKRLLEIQLEIQSNAPEEFADLELISIEELRKIRRIWVRDKHEFDDALPSIYEEVIGKPFYDPDWIINEWYGKEEWDLLKKVCDELFPKEELSFEMMYSLIDIENEATRNNNRKGITDKLSAIIKRNYYMNEDDATEYYQSQLERKKNHGGKYNEKFFDLFDENEEELVYNDAGKGDNQW